MLSKKFSFIRFTLLGKVVLVIDKPFNRSHLTAIALALWSAIHTIKSKVLLHIILGVIGVFLGGSWGWFSLTLSAKRLNPTGLPKEMGERASVCCSFSQTTTHKPTSPEQAPTNNQHGGLVLPCFSSKFRPGHSLQHAIFPFNNSH